jgi:hypothetical protein
MEASVVEAPFPIAIGVAIAVAWTLGMIGLAARRLRAPKRILNEDDLRATRALDTRIKPSKGSGGNIVIRGGTAEDPAASRYTATAVADRDMGVADQPLHEPLQGGVADGVADRVAASRYADPSAASGRSGVAPGGGGGGGAATLPRHVQAWLRTRGRDRLALAVRGLRARRRTALHVPHRLTPAAEDELLNAGWRQGSRTGGGAEGAASSSSSSPSGGVGSSSSSGGGAAGGAT